ncbi:cytochrome P450, partial [Cantharellus anzutake]|uniref:cytochrome P450 n=1 Tax=Cantharellus anzutake TaxID=1750568 RepID=UPI0019076FD6
IETFFFLMTPHPEVQQRTQEELDRVIRPDRLPTMQDYEDLLYLVAVMKEVLRWSTPVRIAVPHVVTADDEY